MKILKETCRKTEETCLTFDIADRLTRELSKGQSIKKFVRNLWNHKWMFTKQILSQSMGRLKVRGKDFRQFQIKQSLKF